MAQPNVAREPSMEEILASIRQIIENNEPPEDALPDVMDESGSHEGIHLTVEGNIKAYEASEIPERSEPVAAEPTAPPVEQKPTSLADVAARVRAAAERGPMPHFDHGQTRVEHQEPEFSAPDLDEAEDQTDDRQEAAQDNAASSEVSQAPERAQLALTEATPAIVSPSTGERVSRSFDQLAEALGASSRSLDEIAEEMLRPMLQQWLDDNLPTMVERLVREEIERVARGPRR